MKSNQRKPHVDAVYANLDTTQMSAAERDSARRQLRKADSVAEVLANGLALLSGLFTAGRTTKRAQPR
ncbi:MAG: hypothetical protein ABI440_07490 [Casimicrobiaceae bacterium]